MIVVDCRLLLMLLLLLVMMMLLIIQVIHVVMTVVGESTTTIVIGACDGCLVWIVWWWWCHERHTKHGLFIGSKAMGHVQVRIVDVERVLGVHENGGQLLNFGRLILEEGRRVDRGCMIQFVWRQ